MLNTLLRRSAAAASITASFALSARPSDQCEEDRLARWAKRWDAPAQGWAAVEATTGVRAFAEIERTQRLAANVSDDSPLLKRSDKCCNAKKFEAARCCKPHAVFWQSG